MKFSEITVAVAGSLGDWIESRVGSGEFATADDYLRALIDRDRADEAERETLVAALEAGERSGVSKRRVPDILAALLSARATAGG